MTKLERELQLQLETANGLVAFWKTQAGAANAYAKRWKTLAGVDELRHVRNQLVYWRRRAKADESVWKRKALRLKGEDA